jgi:Putative zinc-finger
MDHNEASQLMASEKYLLDELSPDEVEAFEEHLFACHQCSTDVRAGSLFLEHCKVELAAPAAAGVLAGSKDTKGPGWFAWLRPTFAVPAMAILLLVIGYQNLVTIRRLKQPDLLAAIVVNLGTFSDNSSLLAVHEGQEFLVNIVVPPGQRYSAYKVDLYNPVGAIEASIPVQDTTRDTWPIKFPEVSHLSGTYKVAVHGINASGQDVEVGTRSFGLQIQK